MLLYSVIPIRESTRDERRDEINDFIDSLYTAYSFFIPL